MASRSPLTRLLAQRRPAPSPTTICCRCQLRWASTTPSTSSPPSPTLSRLREDLKSAMRAKDTLRLGVLRTILADITNASKTSTPITDDLSLLSLLKKKIAQSQSAVEEFYQADRKDLVRKEEEQLEVLRQYAGNVSVMSKDDVRVVVKAVIEEIKSAGRKVALGDVMKSVTGPGGKLEGRMVEKATLVGVVREEIGAK